MDTLEMLDFDSIDEWAPLFAVALGPHVPNSVKLKLVAEAPKYIEDARDLLFDLADRDALIDTALTVISSNRIAGYHGSRFTDEEVDSVRSNGLIPLKAEARRCRLIRALSKHPKWHEGAGHLDAAIHAHGPSGSAGRREGQVHLALSKSGLTKGFNHYLTHGAEFDQVVAHALLGQEGVELLAQDGQPTVIRIAVPGAVAFKKAANPYFSLDQIRARGGVPSLLDEFLKAWSYRLAHEGFQSSTLEAGCGMVFRSTVPAAWIVDFDKRAD